MPYPTDLIPGFSERLGSTPLLLGEGSKIRVRLAG